MWKMKVALLTLVRPTLLIRISENKLGVSLHENDFTLRLVVSNGINESDQDSDDEFEVVKSKQ